MIKTRYTRKEEWANSLSHGLGVLVAMIAGYFFLQKAYLNADPFAMPSVFTYISGVITCYAISTLYHAAPPGKEKERFRKFDHAAIYLQIAATYTPICMLVLRNSGYWGWAILAAVWLIAIFGFFYCFTGLKEHSNLETISFLIMGNLIIIGIVPFIAALKSMNAMPTCWWLIAGGVSYSIGALCYSFHKIRYMHSVFHVFCLIGTACHMIAMLYII